MLYGHSLDFARGIHAAQSALERNPNTNDSEEAARAFTNAAEGSPNYEFECALRTVAEAYSAIAQDGDQWDPEFAEDPRVEAAHELLGAMLTFFGYDAEEDEAYWTGKEEDDEWN